MQPILSEYTKYDRYALTTIPFLYFCNCFSQRSWLYGMTGHMDLVMAEMSVLR